VRGERSQPVESPHTLVQLPREPREPAGAHARRRITPGEHAPDTPELVLGRYRTLERLGSGGFGVVWRAHDELLHRQVALKRVWLGPEGDGERASREALAAARLAHPAIVALHEACAQDGAFYLISELVDGHTLAQLIVEGSLEDEEILEIGVALASALLHAHARGVIHRDIKPQNVLVPHPPADEQRAPQALLVAAKLTDFGGASLVGEEALTRTGDVLGTLAYMSPEQSEGREAGAHSDLYSLALVIYEALCDVNPVRGATPAATARRIGQRLPPLQRARRDLPRPLTAALDRALAPAPAERGSLEDLRAAFEQALERGLRTRRTLLAPGRPRHEHIAAPLAPRHPRDDHATTTPPPPEQDGERHFVEPHPAGAAHRLAPTRTVWLACGLALVVWQALAGRPGAALLALAALLPLLALCGPRGATRAGAAWLACLLAPALGYVGLAGAFPAIAGQTSRWRERAALGALGFWWLRLAEPLLGARLWLGEPRSTPTRAAWEGSVSLTATHVVGPLLATGVLLGALLWASAAAVLPWIVRGRSAVRDLVAVSVWAALLAASSPVLDAGLSARGAAPDPRGLVLGAVVGALLAVAARALRGPVRGRPSERVRGDGA
jgi:serine/threonine protein kinase